jgi:predicted deacylase
MMSAPLRINDSRPFAHQSLSDLDFRDFHNHFEQLASTRGASVRRLANGGCLVLFGQADLPRLAIMSGVHGDERSGPLALLDWLRHLDHSFSLDMAIWMVPLLNDVGWDANVREWQGINLNSAFLSQVAPSFVAEVMADLAAYVPRVFLDLHEDSEKPFPYVFRYSEDRHDFVTGLQQVLGAVDIPWSPDDIQPWKGSTEIYVRHLGCDRSATIEAPPAWPLDTRIEWNLRAVRWCIKEWKNLIGSA